ncbi:MAG: hypothetical protein N2578_08675, partial [Bdellovibrionaceae bacterium]|nr:hypothetical protein [Pseudobdellovibrionaceae bacterium]
LTDTKETDSEPVKVEDYSPWPWLWPRYWIPFVGTSSSSGGAFFQILTSNADPLARHKYSLVLGHDTAVAQTSFEARYFNSNQPLEWGIEVGRTARDLIYSPVIRDNRAVVFRYPLWHWKRHLWLTASTQHQTLSDKFSSQSQLGVSSGLRWAEVSKGGRQITPQEGSAWYVNINPWFAGREGGSWTQLQTGGSLYFSNFLPEWHSLLLRGQMSLTNGPLHSAFGESTVAFAPRNDFNQPLALLRGYRSGSLFGRNLLSTTSEWRFPLKEIWRGRGTVPVFLRRLHGALVSDAASADGFFFDPATKSFLETNIGFPYFSWGFEMHLETTVGYALPLNMILGFYDGSHAPASLSLSFQLGALF